jgi:hypothetical protein
MTPACAGSIPAPDIFLTPTTYPEIPMTNELLCSLFLAVAQVESGGNPKAYNPKENAAGIVQIRPCVLADVNSFYGTHYTSVDRYSPAKSKEIFSMYTRYWVRYYAIEDTPEHRARIWNGGPTGYLKSSTKGYWKRVKANLK